MMMLETKSLFDALNKTLSDHQEHAVNLVRLSLNPIKDTEDLKYRTHLSETLLDITNGDDDIAHLFIISIGQRIAEFNLSQPD
ncbi:hypothetical protein [Photobacterium leiognathi]|uniref:hypothetical protein n=1 Tax=Photobacterium leiognathi TaxID=553611 RepID=UPI002981AEF6|nr:hypothetical protein [Photobacterium leiognathi]